MSITYSVCMDCHAVNKLDVDMALKQHPVCGSCKADLPMHGLVTEIDGPGLKKIVEKSELPVVVDFWAPWCGPCKMFAPAFETASEKMKGQMVFVKFNTEEFPDDSMDYNIRGIPTLLVFKGGKEVGRESGAFPLPTFLGWIKRFL